ncbi:MAG: MerR family transcriptional regulator [Hespellia sp.]|nr:MerR family transcriptional regulator [Hespellia sp.]
MKKSISEMAKLSGVSVRTLHYYDEIGLLVPSEVISETGYRYYDENSLEKLQQILFYRELDFPLKEIAQIVSASDYNKEKALTRQRELLKLKRKRLDKLIGLLDANLKGDTTMSFDEFDTTEIDEAKAKYAEEVKGRWGGTDAYTQSQKKTAHYTKEDWNRINDEQEDLQKQFAECIGENPASERVQELVRRWQKHITDYYYDCTKEILSGLGQMYVLDERFTKNIDKHGKGTAKFMSEAFEVYCKKY